MENLNVVAIAKAINDKAVKAAVADLAPGVHHVDAYIHVKGTVTRGEDFEKTIPQTIPWCAAFGAAMSKLNQATQEIVMAEVLAAIDDKEAKEALEASVKDDVTAKIKAAKGETKALVNGVVKAALTLEEVNVAEVEHLSEVK